jgi:two-component system nitrogen regulation response regulator NtrX
MLMTKMLIVDDEQHIRKSLKEILEDEHYEVLCAADGREAVDTFTREYPDVVLLDIKLPCKDGLEVLKEIKSLSIDCEVIMITGHGTIDAAVDALKNGAYHFLQKPLSMLDVRQTVKNAAQTKLQRSQLNELRKKEDEKYHLVGSGHVMEQLRTQIAQIAPTNGRVLISGESGSGKELVAYALHKQSPRANKPFVKINCAAIPENLIESELFGHEKGAFTGAVGTKKGKFELAHTGTLFLDEIGDMDAATQTKVLRVLQDGELQRVGGTQTIRVDVRVIAATNKNLAEMIADGTFREDLYYRLCVLPIAVPSLSRRREDIPELVHHFLHRYCLENGLPEKKLSQDALTLLSSYQYPGNIRQLRNIVERLAILAPDNTIEAPFVQQTLQPSGERVGTDLFTKPRSLQQAKEELEREFVTRQLQLHQWDIARTAQVLGIQRTNLHRKIKQLGIEK